MPLTAGRDTPARAGTQHGDPIAANVVVYQGGLVVLDAAGNARPGYVATGLIARGRAVATVDNTGGPAGAKTVESQPGVFRYNNSAAGDAITRAEIGDTCFIVDDETVAKTSATNTRSVAGVVVDVDALGVWVRIG
jgi:hypothetical protein